MIEYIFVGIAWFGIGFPLIPDALKFIFTLYNPSINISFLIGFYAIFNIILIPLVVFLWLIALTNLLNLKPLTRKIVLIIYGIFSIILETFIVFFIFTDISLIGKSGSIPYQVTWSTLSNIVLVLNLGIVLITGFMFTRELLTSIDKAIKIRGKILLTAFITFVVGSLFDMIGTTSLSNIIARSILMLSSIEFYFGFLFPQWIKNYFLDEIA
jgi:hypothetical protein